MLDAPEFVIAHGCNSKGVMSSGVAKQIKDKWPKVYEWYKQECEPADKWVGPDLGHVIWCPIWSGNSVVKEIANCITQENYGRSGELYVDYEAIRACMKAINGESMWRNRVAERNPEFGDQDIFESFALPKIGAGLGGGDWDQIESIIEEECVDVQPVVYCLED